MEKRIALAGIFTGQTKGIKTFVKELLRQEGIYFTLQTLKVETPETTVRFTFVVMEGARSFIYQSRDELMSNLEEEFPGIIISADWDEKESLQPFNSSTIDQSLYEFAGAMFNAFHNALPYFGKVSDSKDGSVVSYAAVKNINITYKERIFLVDVQMSLDWNLFLEKIKKLFEFSGETSFYVYQKLGDGTISRIIDVSGLVENQLYYVKTETDKVAKWGDEMNAFFGALKNLGFDEDDVAEIQDTFRKNKIKYPILKDLTKDELKLDLKLPLGLRQAILMVTETLP